MPDLRAMLERLEAAGELLRIRREVEPRFELAALLTQAEARRKAVLFEAVAGSPFPVAGGLLTTAGRFALGLGRDDAATFTREDHRRLTLRVLNEPVGTRELVPPPARQQVLRGSDIDTALLPVPTCFAGDSGPFLTAAVGFCRNPHNGVINAGIYRVLVTGRDEVAVSVGPSSDLLGFLRADAEAGRVTKLALAVGVNPEMLMAAAAKVPPDVSELDVAGAFCETPLAVMPALDSDLLLPAESEFTLEVEIDHTRSVPNTMGEFGDLYGTQVGHVAKITSLSHRDNPVFHTIMAGAGKEHNSLGFLILYDIEPLLREQLAEHWPQVTGVRVHFAPPAMGMPGEIYLQLSPDSGVDVAALIRDVFGMRCGRWDIARVIRRVIVTDTDIDVTSARELEWAVNNRALTSGRFHLFEDLPLPGVGLRIGIDTTVAAADREKLQRLTIPGAQDIRLDDYL